MRRPRPPPPPRRGSPSSPPWTPDALALRHRHVRFLVLKFLREEGFEEARHRYERDSGIFFDLGYVEELALKGEWEEAERYVSGFTKIGDNGNSLRIFFEIRKQKYLEALERKDRAAAAGIVCNELTVFRPHGAGVIDRLTMLLTADDLRENEELAGSWDPEKSRRMVFGEVEKLVRCNPLLRGKLQFPSFPDSLWEHFDFSCSRSGRSLREDARTAIPRNGCGPWRVRPTLFAATEGEGAREIPARDRDRLFRIDGLADPWVVSDPVACRVPPFASRLAISPAPPGVSTPPIPRSDSDIERLLPVARSSDAVCCDGRGRGRRDRGPRPRPIVSDRRGGGSVDCLGSDGLANSSFCVTARHLSGPTGRIHPAYSTL